MTGASDSSASASVKGHINYSYRELVRFGLAELKLERRLDTYGLIFHRFCVNMVETASETRHRSSRNLMRGRTVICGSVVSTGLRKSTLSFDNGSIFNT